jgi:hypothetical protein
MGWGMIPYGVTSQQIPRPPSIMIFVARVGWRVRVQPLVTSENGRLTPFQTSCRDQSWVGGDHSHRYLAWHGRPVRKHGDREGWVSLSWCPARIYTMKLHPNVSLVSVVMRFLDYRPSHRTAQI